MIQPRKTVIVGGGVIGAMTAWYLTQAGRQVTVIDQGNFGSACSASNCGYVAPSHVFPLAGPGKWKDGIKGLCSRNGALKIRPGWNLSLWKWLFRFALHCNWRDALHAGSARHELLTSSRRLYDTLIEEHSLDVEWKTDGLLFVCRDQRTFDRHAKIMQDTCLQFDVVADMLDGSDLEKQEPALKPGLAGAFHYKSDAHLRPDRLMSELQRLLVAHGVAIVEHQKIQAIQGNSVDRAIEVRSEDRAFRADEFVIATGAWAPELNEQLGCRIPVQPGKGYSVTMSRPDSCPQYPLLLEEAHVGITPFETGYRVGSTMEFSGYQTDLDPRRIQYLMKGAADYLKEPPQEPFQEQWYGWRPMTPDGLPYLDFSPRFQNVFVATGHNMLGLSMAPATGKIVAEILTEKRPHIDSAPFRMSR